MAYPSVDRLQTMLADEVFVYAKDRKKAAGRALGTFVEIVTFYALSAWSLRDHVVIERSIPEFANPEITHNVEFSLHPIAASADVALKPLDLPVTARKVLRNAEGFTSGFRARPGVLVSKRGIMRNSAVVAVRDGGLMTAHVAAMDEEGCVVTLADLAERPFAIFECKRVGVEEGMRKGPQSIEKAKQGAYVARSVSSLQKIRLECGQIQGVIDVGGGRLRTDEYHALLRETIDGDSSELLRRFILTVGVVSNHGNWFTADDHNKELRVLAHSYDWLLFLTDAGLCGFIEKLLVSPSRELEPARAAFLSSYGGGSTKKTNTFTKVNVRADADLALKLYFRSHEAEVEGWFNVISPRGGTIRQLRDDLVALAGKDWNRIHQP